MINKMEFNEYYKLKTSQHKNSFDIFLELHIMMHDEPINIMVGTSNKYENDYYRFNKNTYYSLHVNSNQHDLLPESQYEMFTINYEDVSSNFNKMERCSVNEIHFDTCVSYFAPIEYLKIAEHVLIPGGKIVWDLADHCSSAIFYSSKHDEYYDSRNNLMMTRDKVDGILCERYIMLTLDEKGEMILIPKNDHYYEINKINPQMVWTIVDRDLNYKQIKKERCLGFVDYCSKTYPEFYFEQKKYTHYDVSYPSPIRIVKISQDCDDFDGEFIINVYRTSINFIANYVMNFKERQQYVSTKKISIEKLIQLNDRIYVCADIKNKMLEHHIIPYMMLQTCMTDENTYDYETLKMISMEYFHNEFNAPNEYIEAVKL